MDPREKCWRLLPSLWPQTLGCDGVNSRVTVAWAASRHFAASGLKQIAGDAHLDVLALSALVKGHWMG
jgi:hypothetical protein